MSRIRRLDPSPTIRAMNSAFKDRVILRWDEKFSPSQEMSRVAPRAALGRKQTPTGRGRALHRR
jgi:hypothetical protein